jgi:hypothetical protein
MKDILLCVIASTYCMHAFFFQAHKAFKAHAVFKSANLAPRGKLWRLPVE